MTWTRGRAAAPRAAVRRVLPWTAASVALALAAALAPSATAVPVGPSLGGPCTSLGSLQVAGARAGASAVSALGSDLEVAAARNAMSPSALRALLRSDRRARLDVCGRVYFAEPMLTGPAASEPATMSSAGGIKGALDPSGNVFSLSSRPGSARTIYLDFTGHVLTGTAWNSEFGVASGYQLAAYDTNGSAALSVTELNEVRSIWLRVAEDYAPFDVNVTTVEPAAGAIERSGSRDLVYGTRAVVTNDLALLRACQCGGIAYVGVFGATASHEVYQPALVLTRGLSFNTKAIAEAVSHEVGHTFGLWHDGTASSPYSTGQGLWAPIMGVGYYRPLTQWSKGDYPGATETQDDAAVIATNAPYVADEAGASLASAPQLTSGVPVAGVVSRPDDVDYYGFVSGGGALTVAVNPEAISPDLDARLDVYTADAALVASVNPSSTSVTGDVASGLGAAWSSLALPAGRYVVAVSGAGAGNPADSGYTAYGSRGRYTVTVVYPTPARLAVATAALPEAVVGLPYSAALVAAAASGATTWRVVAGALPAGVVLDAASGVLSGTPTVLGQYPLTVRVTDAAGPTAAAALVVDVVAPVAVTTASLPPATLGSAYSAPVSAAGGDGGYVVSLASGSLPSGLALTASGRLYGLPSRSGRYDLTVRVADYSGHGDLLGRVATRALTLVVARPVLLTTASLATARKGRAYAASLAASGGTGTYTWFRTSGSLPPGTALSVAGRLAGTPTRAGRWSVTVGVRDSAGRTAVRTFVLVVS